MNTNSIFTEQLEILKNKGYNYRFIKKNDSLYCSEKDLNFRSYELSITEQFRYEDKREPSKNTVLYAIESTEYGLKGFLVNNS
ncbi:MAG: hypothetical protein JST81_06405 [Bacteroidetes bacterium]|jgi:hypothetical protein|nr:hypothetical protein [Bacteroidota bacterium]